MSSVVSRRRALFVLAGGIAAVASPFPPQSALAAYDASDAFVPFSPARRSLATAAGSPITIADVTAAVSHSLAGVGGSWGVAVRNLKNGQTFVQNGDDFFPSASIYKLAVMYEVFRQNAAGLLSLDEVISVRDDDLDEGMEDEELSPGDQVPVRKALDLMISVSDNGAAHILAYRVGWEQLNVSMAKLGLNHTRVPVGDWQARWADWRRQDACTSPNDLLVFLDRLYHRQLVSPAASAAMIQLLLGDQINDRIPANLPPNTRVAHKIGNLDGVVNDAGIVFGPKADFIIVMLGNNVDSDGATTAEAILARRVYDLYNA